MRSSIVIHIPISRYSRKSYIFQGIVGSLHYMTSTKSNIVCEVVIINQFMEKLYQSHLQAIKWILRYINGIHDHEIFYSYLSNFNLVGYIDYDWGGDVETRKNTIRHVFSPRIGAFVWSSKKQQVVVLLTIKVEYMTLTSIIYKLVWSYRMFS